MSVNRRTYPYKQKWWLGPACVVLFGLCAWMFWFKAHQPPRGLIINHLIELSPGGAQVLHWSLFAVSMLLAAMGVLVFIMSFKSERHITISATSIRAPKAGSATWKLMFRLAASSLFNCKKFSDSAFCTSITQEGSCPSFNPCFRRKLNSKKFAHFYLQSSSSCGATHWPSCRPVTV